MSIMPAAAAAEALLPEAGPSKTPQHASRVASSSSPARAMTVPLAPARTVEGRRGVNFSPQPYTRYFDSADSILPDKSDPPPPSIRSYAESLPLTLLGSTPPSASDVTPRSILKRKQHIIRLARSVEEGTLNNREPARLMVTGRRPGLTARDSFQLAMLRKGADELSIKHSQQHGDVPGSDDSAGSDERDRQAGNDKGKVRAEEMGSSDEEEEEEIEQDGALATASLVNIILHGAEDLLTLEEAYKTLTLRLKSSIPLSGDDVTDSSKHEIEIAVRPVLEDAPAMVRALQRDLQRLLGKVPNAEQILTPDRESSPFSGLMPLHDSTPVNQKSHLASPPLSDSTNKSPNSATKPMRQGYSEAEVRYRREAAGVGSAAMNFLALALHTEHIFSCFTEADIQSLLDVILVIPRTPQLPTPNPKRTHFSAVSVISNMRVPLACVNPLKDKLAKAIEVMTSDTFGSGGVPIKDNNFRKEVYSAIVNLITTYPSTFFHYSAELLAPSLRNLSSPIPILRNRAAAAIVAFAAAKYNIQQVALDRIRSQRTPAARSEWVRTRVAVSKSETFVINYLKRPRTLPGKPGSAYGPDGEKRTEWTFIEKLLKEKMGTDVHWTCGLWAALVSLIGASYTTCGLSVGIDHIMDRSLQISANTTRPVLARIAWSHAIHAYLSAGTAQSINDDHQLVQTFKPFASFANQDWSKRLQKIQLPINIAFEAGLAVDSYSRSCAPSSRFEDSPRCFWERKEKAKRMQVITTCGEGMATVIYAFVGIALTHEDQPAKEVSAVTGLPSSDGAPMPEMSLVEAKMDRLDKTWDKVVQPLLESTFKLYGLDKLKIHGWSLLEALVRQTQPTDSTASNWDLDRLLCTRYLSGEALEDKLKDKEVGISFLNDIEKEAIAPKDVPSLGAEWVVRRLSDLLDLFQQAVAGINGLNDLYGGESVSLGQGVVFPVVLSRVWAHLLNALASSRSDATVFAAGVRLVTRHLCQIFNGEPADCLPISLMGENETWTVDLDATRILIFTRLFDMAHHVLGAEAVSLPILSGENGDEVDVAMSQMAFGADSTGHYSMAGSLLALLMGTKVFSTATGLAPQARLALTGLARKLLDIGSVQSRLLGDMTNRLHAVYEDQEAIQLDMWRVLASKWASIVDTGRSTSSGTNHTGALLVSLLSNPFRGRQVHSVWHRDAADEDLAIWNNLLQVVVARFRAKRVGSNLGVLETLAGHLGDFLRDADKASSSTITLSCLASAASYISCTELSHHVEDHYSINENYVPCDFLTLVSDALDEAYPRAETLEAIAKEDAVSPAVYDLLSTLSDKLDSLPVDFAMQAFEAVRPGLLVWLSDDSRVVMPHQAAVQVDQLYISIVHLHGRAIEAGQLARQAATVDGLLDVLAPRLSRAVSRRVPEAFQAFWAHFAELHINSFSSDTAAFLQSLLAAVPDIIAVNGLTIDVEMSEDESFAQYPYAREVESQSQLQPLPTTTQALVPPTPEDAADITEDPIVPVVDISTEYDADMSASLEATQVDPATDEVRPEVGHQATTSPASSIATEVTETETEQGDSQTAEDVFGSSSVPVAAKQTKKKGRKGSRASAGRKRKVTKTRSAPTIPVAVAEAATTPTEPKQEPVDDDVVVQETPAPLAISTCRANAGLLQHASRWVSGLTTFGGLFSPKGGVPESSSSASADGASPGASGSRKRKSPTQLTRSVSEPQLPTSSTTRSSKRAKTTTTTTTPSTRSWKHDEPIVIDDSDDEDELLLSPESARKRQAEEQAALAAARAQASRPSTPQATQNSSGRFDDAPDPTQLPAHADPSASPVTTAQHTRLLNMLRTLSDHMDVLRSMNHADFEQWQDDVTVLANQTNQVTRERYKASRERAKGGASGSR